MLYKFMEDYCKELKKSFKALEKSTNAAIKGEPKYRDGLKEREEKLAEIDGIPMTDEEVETNVAIQAQASPYRRKVNEDARRVLKVMKDG